MEVTLSFTAEFTYKNEHMITLSLFTKRVAMQELACRIAARAVTTSLPFWLRYRRDRLGMFVEERDLP